MCGRFALGHVPNMNWNGRTLNLNYYHPENSNPNLRLRQIVSAAAAHSVGRLLFVEVSHPDAILLIVARRFASGKY